MASLSRSLRAAATAGILAGSCTVTACEDGPLLSPDDAECTRGTIALDRPEAGRISETSCLASSLLDSSPILTESWTLHAERDRVYIVRLNPLGEYATLDLVAVTRDGNGEPSHATSQFTSYREPGEEAYETLSREMLLPSYREQDIALRVESTIYDGDVPPALYSISVTSCPIRALPSGRDLRNIETIAGCPTYSFGDSGAEALSTFLKFKGEAGGWFRLHAEPESVATAMRGLAGGNELDLTETLPTSSRIFLGPREILDGLLFTKRDGWYTLVVAVGIESAVAIRAAAGRSPPPPSPEALR